VRKPLAIAFFSASFVIAIVVGCSAPSPDGDSLNRTRGSSGEDSGVLTPEGVDCTNHEKVDDRPACDQCARANCCEYVVECDETPDCEAIIKCLDDCQGDVLCQFTCSTVHEKGGAVLQDLSACAQSKCKSECPASTPDAGEDPFADAF